MKSCEIKMDTTGLRCWVIVLTTLLQVHLSSAQNYQMTFSIREERPKDTFVGNVSSNSQFLSDIPQEEYGHIRFEFLRPTYIQTLLMLQELTGVITTSVVIDRESRNICRSQSSCALSFSVAVRSTRPQSSYFAIIVVTLQIEDINDNSPLFPRDVLNLEIPESATAGTSFHIESAIDSDAGINSVQSYEIGKQDGEFSLDIVKKLDGSFTVKLLLNSQLDREQKDRYTVMIVAVDGGNPRKFGALTVNVSVTDINDNAPVFVEKNYNITVRENVTIDTTVLQIYATDDDIGENGRVTYRFSQNQLDARVNDLFKITENRGELKLRNKLVYESNRSYTIIAEAVDHGTQQQVTQVIIVVHVVDVGNNPPILEINLLGQENSRIVNLSESASPGTFVAYINIIDKDTGDNGIVNCVISDSKFGLQSMSGQGYKVIVNGDLDRETTDMHNIRITCHDFGIPQLSTSSSFRVSLTDENDCAPVFRETIFTGSIPENHQDFRTFVQIIASDPDLGKNGKVRYYIDTESTDKKFWINEIDGNLRADQMFDRETDPVVTFKVIARDLGDHPLSNKATVQLTITDKNDNPPVLNTPLAFSVMENLHSGSFVGRLHATDADIGINAQIEFFIPDPVEPNFPFVVFKDGEIKTNRQLDREEKSKYEFNVAVIDRGLPKLTSSAMVTIHINDTNDNPPKFIFPQAKNNTAVVNSDVRAGQKVTQIEVKDADYGINQVVSYEIVSGNGEGLFLIDQKQGGIYINRQVSVNKNVTYQLKIVVKDGGYPEHTTESDLKIVLVRAINGSANLHDSDHSNNTTIVIVVVVLTAVLSVVMIIIICFLRKFDHRSKARRNLDIVAPDEKYPKCYMADPSRYLENGNGSLDQLTLTYDPMSPISGPKKKEVSFDIDDHVDHTDLRDQHNTTMSTFSVPESEKLQQLSISEAGEEPHPPGQNGRLNKLQLLQYHQAVLESQTRAWLQSQDGHEESSSFDVTLPDDKYSDTSEEVTASDSGKGGSEDDLPSNHSKDIKNRVNGGTASTGAGKFQTHHYIAPEFRRQGSLQRKACNIVNFNDRSTHNASVNSQVSPMGSMSDDLHCRSGGAGDRSAAISLAHSTPRPNSRTAVFYPKDSVALGNRTVDSALEHSVDYDSASYV